MIEGIETYKIKRIQFNPTVQLWLLSLPSLFRKNSLSFFIFLVSHAGRSPGTNSSHRLAWQFSQTLKTLITSYSKPCNFCFIQNSNAMMETVSLDFLVPSLWEIKVTVAASVFVIFAYWFFTFRGSGGGSADRPLSDNSGAFGDAIDDKDKVEFTTF